MSLKTVALPTVVLMLLAAHPAAAQLPPVDGVFAEPLPTGLRINGLAVQVTHLRGPRIAELVRLTAQQWRAAPQHQGPWQQLSRQSMNSSEVLQWRAAPAGLEAIYSRQPLRQAPQPVATLDLQLPALCNAVSHLQLGAADQPAIELTAQCRGTRPLLQRLLTETVERGGWQPVALGSEPQLWSKPGQTLRMDLIDTPQGLALVALQLGRRGSP
jgi:hypothetical protein